MEELWRRLPYVTRTKRLPPLHRAPGATPHCCTPRTLKRCLAVAPPHLPNHRLTLPQRHSLRLLSILAFRFKHYLRTRSLQRTACAPAYLNTCFAPQPETPTARFPRQRIRGLAAFGTWNGRAAPCYLPKLRYLPVHAVGWDCRMTLY